MRLILACFGCLYLAFATHTLGAEKLAPPVEIVKKASPEVLSYYQSAQRQALVLFIPGILGSRLELETSEGKKVFGRSRMNSKWLYYDGREAAHSTLNEFGPVEGTLIPSVQIYGAGLDELATAVGGTAPVEFSYDWREDIRDSAKKLNEFLLDPAYRGRDAIVVAHSMGGLVAWQWLKTSSSAQRPVNVVALVLVGSPLQGSCEPIKTLIDGYSATRTSKVWESVATRWLFEDAHAAMFTFPSIFELMPMYESDRPCITRSAANGRQESQNHHSEDFWLGRSSKPTRFLEKFGSSTGRDQDEFLSAFRKAIRAGRDFRKSFDLTAVDVPMFFLYSTDVEMEERTAIGESDGWFRVPRTTPKLKNGDGRVLRDSAIDVRFVKPLVDHAFAMRIGSEHGALLADSGFSEFVSSNLRPFLETKYATQTIAHFISIGRRDAVLDSTVLVSIAPTQGQKLDPKYKEAVEVLAAENVTKFAGSTGSYPEMLTVAIGRFRSGEVTLDSAETEVNSLAFLYKRPLTMDVASTLANAALREKKIEAAVTYSVYGLEVAGFDPKSAADKSKARGLYKIFSTTKTESANELWETYVPAASSSDWTSVRPSDLRFNPK
jgi:pimeloyl-ACP methyl ester carboxylesterase